MTLLLTGFPGFIGARLLRQLAEQRPQQQFRLLIQAPLRDVAKAQLQQLGLRERAQLLEGDLVRADLGLDPAQLQDVTEVWHLAAIYDLAVPQDLAWRVNVEGTEHVVQLCRKLPKLARHVYFSTCYVAGDRKGRIYEGELDEGQGFNNHYESTKFWAERAVQDSMADIPTTVIRPAVVVGDSRTGETAKYDGPYYILRALMRAPKWLPIPQMGPGTATLNVVPVDYIVDASCALAADPEALGGTYHLADPNPRPIQQVVDRMLELLGRPPLRGRLPLALVDNALRSRRLEEWLQIPRETVRYLHHPIELDTTRARERLEPKGIVCPSFVDYLPVLVDYLRKHPDQPFLDNRRV